jgi:hypothetical protein
VTWWDYFASSLRYSADCGHRRRKKITGYGFSLDFYAHLSRALY